MLLPVVLSGGITQQPEHLADHAELYAPRAEREVERAADKHGDEDVCPQEIIGSGYLPAQPTVGGKQIFHKRYVYPCKNTKTICNFVGQA